MSVVNPNANLTLVSGSRSCTRQFMFDLLIETAVQEPVRVLVGGNYFPVYQIAYALAVQTDDYYAVLSEGIVLSRAETGYQLVELLQQTPDTPAIILAFDLLSPLMDESLREKEANELLFECILELRRLGKSCRVLISASQPQPRPRLLMALANAVGEVRELISDVSEEVEMRQGRLV